MGRGGGHGGGRGGGRGFIIQAEEEDILHMVEALDIIQALDIILLLEEALEDLVLEVEVLGIHIFLHIFQVLDIDLDTLDIMVFIQEFHILCFDQEELFLIVITCILTLLDICLLVLFFITEDMGAIYQVNTLVLQFKIK